MKEISIDVEERLYDKFGFVSYQAEDINGKKGRIFVSIDKAYGKDFTVIWFQDKEGKNYIINTD